MQVLFIHSFIQPPFVGVYLEKDKKNMLATFEESLKGTSGCCQGTQRVTLLLVVSNFTSECTISLFLDIGTLPTIWCTDGHGYGHLGAVS